MKYQLAVAIGLLLVACPVYAEDARVDTSAQADNTAQNVADREGLTKTPLDQGNSAQERELAASIRRELVKNDALSTNAKNVKIIVQEGMVTLRGAVNSATEERLVEETAARVAGTATVVSEIKVAGMN